MVLILSWTQMSYAQMNNSIPTVPTPPVGGTGPISGGDSSGGGGGIFCPPSVKNQPAVQMLDLYEGAIIDKLHYEPSSGTVNQWLEKAFEKLSFDFTLQKDFIREYYTIQENVEYLPEGVVIHTPPDLGGNEAVVKPLGCTIEAIGYYETNGTLMISTSAYNQLDTLNKSAFWLHEVAYKLARKYSRAKDSKKVRRFIAHLMAYDSSFANPLQGLIELSTSMNIRTILNDPNWGPLPLLVDWVPAPGKEVFFPGPHLPKHRYLPILLPGKNSTISISYKNPLDKPTEISIFCSTLVLPSSMPGYPMPKIDFSYEEESSGPMHITTDLSTTGKHCESLDITIQTEEDIISFDILVDGEKYAEVTGLFPNSANVAMPLYYQDTIFQY